MRPLVSDRSWVLDAPSERVWTALAQTDSFRSWWPWLRRFDAPDGLAVGAGWHCAVKPPMPYTVRFRVVIDDVRPPVHIAATVTGDIAGHARIDLTPSSDSASTLRLRSTLRPVRRPLVALGLVAPPVTRWGHDWVLATGVRQFAARATATPP